MSLRHTLFLLLIAPLLSCTTSEDSWMHYENGGAFVTRTASLSQDGRVLIYATPCSGHGDIYALRGDSHIPARLTSSQDFEASPHIIPGHDRIVYCRESNGCRHLWTMKMNGQEQVQWTTGNVWDDPLWVSTDGGYVIFQRSKSMVRPKTAAAYVIALGADSNSAKSVGQMAVFTPDSRYVVFTEDLASLKRLDLQHNSPSSFEGSGWPLGFSTNGEYLLTTRLKSDQPWTVDQELWVRNNRKETEQFIARGHSGILFGVDRTYMLYFEGFNKSPQLRDLNENISIVVDCGEAPKSFPSMCGDGKGVVLSGFTRSGEPEMEVFLISATTGQARSIAKMDCQSVENRLLDH